jgi:hypothetical protein
MKTTSTTNATPCMVNCDEAYAAVSSLSSTSSTASSTASSLADGYESPSSDPAVAANDADVGATPSAASFPQKLHRMLCEAPTVGFEDVCAWEVGGTAFRIHSPQRFVTEVMPHYFSQQTKYKSFQRMLNIYNFLRVPHGPHKGCYAHKNFVQSQPQLAATIQRYNHKAWKKNRQERLRALQQQHRLQQEQGGSIVTPPVAKQVTTAAEVAAAHSIYNNQRSHYNQHSHHHHYHHPHHHAQQPSYPPGYMDDVVDESATAAAGGYDDHGYGHGYGYGHYYGGYQQHYSHSHAHHSSTLSFDLFRDLDMDSILKDVQLSGNGVKIAKYHHRPSFSISSFMAPDDQGQGKINHDMNENDIMHLFQEDEYNDVNGETMNGHQNQQEESAIQPGSSSASTSSSTMDEELREYEQQMDERFFPIKLYDMLETAEKNELISCADGASINMKSIISWLHGGTAFKVHDTKAFTRYVMPLYFDQTQYESFRRQLNMYGFMREPRGINRGIYHHQSFRRGQRHECRNVFRRTPASSGISSSASKKIALVPAAPAKAVAR